MLTPTPAAVLNDRAGSARPDLLSVASMVSVVAMLSRLVRLAASFRTAAWLHWTERARSCSSAR